MSSLRRELGPSLIESLGIFVLAYFGADALFAIEVPSVGDLTVLITSLAIAIGFFIYRIDEAMRADRAREDAPGTPPTPATPPPPDRGFAPSP